MERTVPSRLPDAICMRPKTNFTQIRNEIFHDENLSYKAKGLLCSLLSNESGRWKSFNNTLQNRATDGPDSIRTGLKELQEAGYLVKIFYVDKKTKRRKGVFWAYTDFPNHFEMESQLKFLKDNDLEIQGGKLKPDLPVMDNPILEEPILENQSLIIINNNNNKKENNTNNNLRSSSQSKHDKITPSLFDEFWTLYPKKADKGKAKTSWNKICNKPPTNRPSWNEIKIAITEQSKTDRWANKKYIPNPTTWLNNQRWLDDPAEMCDWNNEPKQPSKSHREVIKEHFKSKDAEAAFMKSCYQPAKKLLANYNGEIDKGELAETLTNLHAQIQKQQKKISSKEVYKLLPGAMTIISHYIDWIENEEWITNRSLDMFQVNHKLFGKFRRDEASSDNMERDPITGKSYYKG